MLVYQRVYVICIDAQSSSPCMAPDSEQALLAGRAIGVVPSAPSPIFLVNWVNPVRIKHSWYLLCENHLYQLYACSACVYIYTYSNIYAYKYGECSVDFTIAKLDSKERVSYDNITQMCIFTHCHQGSTPSDCK